MLLTWLLQEGDHEGLKHQGWAHPISVYLIHLAIIIVAAFSGHDYLASLSNDSPKDNDYSDASCIEDLMGSRRRRSNCAIFTGTYAILQLVCRLWTTNRNRSCVLYEGTWLCNTTLLVGSLGLWLDRPTVAAAFCIAVGIDQLLWYVDVLSYAATGTFVVGVAKYVTWPSTPWTTKWTCTHHLWTLPLFLSHVPPPLTPQALVLSSLVMVLHVTLSRCMIPLSVQNKYLNVNLSHELWKDIQIGILQINHDNPSALTYVCRLLWRWQAFNIVVYLVLAFLHEWYFGGPLKVCS